MKQEIWRHYPVGNKVELVERLLERGVLDDQTRKITRNRQPGRCCATGCEVPRAPQMLPLPDHKKRPWCSSPGRRSPAPDRPRDIVGASGKRPWGKAGVLSSI